MKFRNHPRLLLKSTGALLFAVLLPARAEIIAAWETTGQSSFGTQDLAASTKAPGITAGVLTRGDGVATPVETAVDDAWGGEGFAASIATGLTTGAYITFTVTPAPGVALSVQTFELHYRRSTDGPQYAALQYQIGGGVVVDLEELWLESDDEAGGIVDGIDLTGYEDLQNHSGDPITFRLVPFDAIDPAGNFLVYGPVEGCDLVLNGVVAGGGGGGDTSPPLATVLTPPIGATGLPAATTTLLTMIFNENVARGSGQILVKESLSGATVYALDVTDIFEVSMTSNLIGLELPDALEAGTRYHVEIPAGAILDQAVPANSYAGLSGSSAWYFTTAVEIAPPRVVVNKYLNGSPDRVELLVVGTGIPSSTVDLRGMILKDFSADMTGDGGGKLVFTQNPLWSQVAAGTLITLGNSVATNDVSPGDFTLAAGLTDPVYFTPVPGSPPLDISATDMVMIKEPGSDPAGTDGGIHALAAGAASPTSYFSLFTGAKIRATATTANSLGARAANTSGSLADFISGTDATGNLPLALSDFGAPNTGGNATFLAMLRGTTPGNGDGVVNVVNATLSSPFLGLPMFDQSQVNQSAKLTIRPRIEGITLANIQIVVPEILGTPSDATLSGPGAAGCGYSVTGQTITLSNASATASSPLEVTIAGLVTPLPTLLSDNGNYPITVATSVSGGTLTPVASQDSARVIIPISSLRDVDIDGVALDAGALVAVEGTVTEADFGGGAANFSGFLQDSTAGINVSSPSLFLGLERGNRFAVVGTLSQINGLTTIIPSSGASLVDRGPVTEITAEEITLAALLANPEAYEGKLLTVRNLSYHSGSWESGQSAILRNSAGTQIEVRIQSGSTATTPPPYPAKVTGIFGQSDAFGPFDSGYQLMPRDPDDVSYDFDDFAAWSIETGAVGGETEDDDFDGRDNAFEYAFGQNPVSGASPEAVVSAVDRATGKFTYTRRTRSLTGLDYKILTSTTLDDWAEDRDAEENIIGTVANVETVEVTLSVAKPIAAPALFIRVEAE